MAWAQSGANSDPTYVALRNIGLGSEVVQVTNFDLKRDAGTFRLNSGTGIARRLIYPKGAYVLHMIRMMMFDNHGSDERFRETMHDFVETYRGKAATTEDFKAMVEKHMTRSMDLDANHKMDWFFNQYVYGTGIAQYNLHASAEATPDGKTHIKGELTRSGVPETWKDALPLYAHMGDKTVRLGVLSVTHSTEPIDVILPVKVDRVSLNDF